MNTSDDVSALVKNLMKDYSKSEHEAFLSELSRLIWAGDIECYMLRPTTKTEGTTLTLSGGVSLRVSDTKFVPRASSEEKLRLATEALEEAREIVMWSLDARSGTVKDRIDSVLARIRGEKPGGPAPP